MERRSNCTPNRDTERTELSYDHLNYIRLGRLHEHVNPTGKKTKTVLFFTGPIGQPGFSHFFCIPRVDLV